MTPKQCRSAQVHLNVLFKRSELMSEYEGFKSYGLMESLRREIRAPNGQKVCLSDKAKESFELLSSMIEQVLPGKEWLEPNDIYIACKTVLGRWYENGSGGDARNFVNEVREEASGLVGVHSFYTALSGLELQGLDEFRFGDVVVHKPRFEVLESSVGQESVIAIAWKHMNYGLWLTAQVKGSPEHAERRFFELVKSSCGLLALAFTASLDHGGLGVRLIPTVEGRFKPGAVTWFSVNSSTQVLNLKTSFDGLQRLELSEVNATSLLSLEWFSELSRISQLHTGNDAERAVQRALYWFFDAQADNILEMKFVKYWSCIECMFSLDKGKVTQQIKRGLAAVLSYCRFRPSKIEDWSALNRRIVFLYDLRSAAVHDAQHGHVKQQDVVDVSKWAAFILMEVSMMISKGMETRTQLKENVDCIHEYHSSVAGTSAKEGN